MVKHYKIAENSLEEFSLTSQLVTIAAIAIAIIIITINLKCRAVPPLGSQLVSHVRHPPRPLEQRTPSPPPPRPSHRHHQKNTQ